MGLKMKTLHYYLRHHIFQVEEIFDLMNDGVKIGNFNNQTYGLTSLRLKTFQKAFNEGKFQCVCGLKPKFFSLDTFPGAKDQSKAHVNLIGQTTEKEILFTHDHILARCLGGNDSIENTQLMCQPCNNKKSRHEQKLFLQK